LKNWGIHFSIPKLKTEIEELDKETLRSDFWDDLDNSQKILQLVKNKKTKLERYESLIGKYEDINAVIELSGEENDEAFAKEALELEKVLTTDLEEMRLETLLSGEYDNNNAILSLHSGAGGTEAQDWVQMLYRMYLRWAEKRGYKIETLDYLDGDEAGIKSVTFMVSGEKAYGYLKCEKGVHRLVRISPFDASGRRHTSFASLDVVPELPDDIVIDINPEDLKVDTYRSSGAGGQHINKTESAIRITHIPTGIVVACQNERSQHKNRDTAMKMLYAKLLELKEKAHKEKIDDLKGEQLDIGWGSQIRSYVFHPYSMVKDHRTSAETGNVTAVMDGELDMFINEYLKQSAKSEE